MEVDSIKWNFTDIDILTGGEAKESWLLKNIGNYGIIHIASHGEFDDVNPLFSSLKLVRDVTADGNLEMNEVFSLDIKADLITLSACQTGLGQITGGDEIIGMNRAFFYAGTHSIISSLWRISDISTSILIKHFYRNYNFLTKAEALRKAQLFVKKLYPHPSYWSGLTLTGDYR
jgi:CHAT domain-containing protein